MSWCGRCAWQGGRGAFRFVREGGWLAWVTSVLYNYSRGGFGFVSGHAFRRAERMQKGRLGDGTSEKVGNTDLRFGAINDSSGCACAVTRGSCGRNKNKNSSH